MDDLRPVRLHKKRYPQFSWSRRYLFLPILVLLGAVYLIFGRQGDSPVLRVLGGGSSLKIYDGRVNILLLGIAGGNHDGPNLTDTIMVASYDTHSHNVTLVSIPRDLWLSDYHGKVNTLYEDGLAKGNGLGLAEQKIGQILGITIPYGARIDFDGFTKAVDLVGGVDVVVQRSFDDYAYPFPGKEADMCGYKEAVHDITDQQARTLGVEKGKLKVLLDPQGNIATAAATPDAPLAYNDDQVLQYFSCRFEHLTFKAGPLHLDGATALKYVRSRHGTNGEGSDFARSRRQQQVLQAFEAKVFSLGTLADLPKVISLIRTFGESLDTDIPQSEYPDFLKLAKDVGPIKSYVIDGAGSPEFLINPDPADYGGSWVLIPPNNDFTAVHSYIHGILSPETASGSAQVKQ